VSSIEKTFKKHSPAYPFEYSFLDETFAREYRTESVIGSLSLIFTVIAILISCLGLFGLAMYSAVKRTKEIGIRKVVGAGTFHIVRLLSNEFLKLIAIAFIIAEPIAYLIMNRWLQDFAYRTSTSWWIFMLAGVLAILLALVTIGFQAIRAAVANPVTILRSE
jgi:ABC-type antimicrobial peptide transport system permease subunit